MCHGVRVGRTLLSFSFASFVLLFTVSFASDTKAATISVPAGGSLQSAINAAQPGDTIIVDAGAVYVGPIVLPVKSGTSYITIQSSRVSELPDGVRVTPAQRSLMASVVSDIGGEPVVKAQAGAHHFKFIGIEFSTANAGVLAYTLIEFGQSSQTTLDAVPHHLVIDRSYVHGFPTQEVQRGISFNSAYTDVLNSYISEVHGRGYDTQAICGWNGPGPFTIINNYLEAAGENVMFGGSPAAIPNLVPTGITVKNNYMFKPLSWYVNDPTYAGIHWSVKNLFELKNARQVVVDGNVFENNWTDAQAGRSIVFTPRPSDSGLAAVIEDVQFTNNIIRNVGSGMLLLGADEPPAPTDTRLRRVRVANNLFDNIDGARFASNGAFLTVINATDSVTIEHNTAIQTGNIIISDYAPNTGFVYTDNITRHNEYGIIGSGHGIGNDSISYYFPGSILTRNVIAKEVNSPWNVDSIYPAGNFYPANLDAVGFVDWKNGNYHLASSSPYKGAGTGGTDPGCNIDVLTAVLGGGSSPTPPPSPTPTPTPTPVPTPTPTPTPLTVSISSPNNNTTFSLGSSVNVTANAADVGGTVTNVEFYAGSQLIGSSAVSPYAAVWNNMVAGTYYLTAKAQDNRGLAVTSNPVTVKISKSLKSVRNNRKNANQLTNSGTLSVAGDALLNASAFDSFIADLEQTYNDFTAERSMFNSAAQIDRYLFAAVFFAKSGDALAREAAPSSGVIDRLNKVDAYLSFCEDLMVSDTISQASVANANQVNARVDLSINQTSTAPLSGAGFMLSANAAAKVMTTSVSPFGTQSGSAGNGAPQYELANVSVTVNGRAAALLMVSPTQVNFTVPNGVTSGLSEIVVTSREGNVVRGTVAVTGLNPTVFGWSDDTTGQGAILDAVGLQSMAFPVTGSGQFLPDLRTRLTIFASGISTGVANTDAGNDIRLSNGGIIANLAESVAVEARLGDGRVYTLPVEFAGAQGGLPGLDQVNVVLVPELRGAGSVQLTLVVNGVRSNAMRVTVQ